MFIKEDSEFETALNLVKGILADGSEFPEQIFQKQFYQILSIRNAAVVLSGRGAVASMAKK